MGLTYYKCLYLKNDRSGLGENIHKKANLFY